MICDNIKVAEAGGFAFGAEVGLAAHSSPFCNCGLDKTDEVGGVENNRLRLCAPTLGRDNGVLLVMA